MLKFFIIMLTTIVSSVLLTACNNPAKTVTSKYNEKIVLNDEYLETTELLLDALKNHAAQQQVRFKNLRYNEIAITKDKTGINVNTAFVTYDTQQQAQTAKQFILELKGIFCSGKDLKISVAPLLSNGRFIDYIIHKPDNTIFTTIGVHKAFCETSDETLFERHKALLYTFD